MERTSRQLELAQRGTWDDVEGLGVAVIGLGRSGVAAANALARRGANVLAYDDLPEAQLGERLNQLDKRIEVRCGGGFVSRRDDLAVISPGLPPHSETFRRANAQCLALLGEVELFVRLDRAFDDGRGHPLIAVTGTDGKTTTTLLIAHLLKTAGYDAHAAGNIGEPLCERLDQLGDDAVVVAEVSAFQLITCPTFRPRIAILTNIAADHLDFFAGDMEAYIGAKTRVAAMMAAGDTLLVNGDDAELADFRASLDARARHAWAPVSTAQVPARGFGLDGSTLIWAPGGGTRVPLIEASELGCDSRQPLVGTHNIENALAASGAAIAFGLNINEIRPGLRTFAPPAHRLEPVGSIGEVRFINDSKATNPHAAIAGLRAVKIGAGERLVWIGGGSEKDADFTELAAEVAARSACAIVIGQTGPRIAALLPDGYPVVQAPHLHEAIATALERCGGAGVVLLSPACASYDQFRSYSHRGDVFRDAVEKLSQALSAGGQGGV